MAVLTVATCQFPVAADVGANLHHVKHQMMTASRRGARVAHFPEGALSGYAGTDFETFTGSTGTGSVRPPPRWLNTPGGWG